MLSFKLKKQTNKNVADTNFNRKTTAVLTGQEEVDTFCILNFFCLFFFVCNKCYKKSGTFKCEVVTKILKNGLANFAKILKRIMDGTQRQEIWPTS